MPDFVLVMMFEDGLTCQDNKNINLFIDQPFNQSLSAIGWLVLFWVDLIWRRSLCFVLFLTSVCNEVTIVHAS